MKDEEMINYYDKNLIKHAAFNIARKQYNIDGYIFGGKK